MASSWPMIALRELVFHLEQALGFLLGQLHERHAGPHGDDFGDVLGGNDRAVGPVPTGAQTLDLFAELDLTLLPVMHILAVAFFLGQRAVLAGLS